MRIIESIDEMREYSQQLKRDGKTIASVDIGSFMHDGHMQLVEVAKQHSDVVIVNLEHTPEFLAFGEGDYNPYMVGDGSISPIWEEFISEYNLATLPNDIELCKKHGVDILFLPSMEDMYNNVSDTTILSPLPVAETLAKIYPKHSTFSSVMVRELIIMLNILSPDISVVGQKDILQSFTLKKIINDLKYPIKLIRTPIYRNPNGLAYSSRNQYLSESERKQATSIYQTLYEVSKWSIYPSIEKIKEHIINRIEGHVNYVSIFSIKTLQELSCLIEETVILVSVTYDGIDLTDNIIIDPERIKR